MASVFDGFRLDNAHSTPLHVCEHMLGYARRHNKNLFVMAELFTPKLQIDVAFAKKLNLNGMIREIQNRTDAAGVGAYFWQLTCQENVIGKVSDRIETDEGKSIRILNPRTPRDVIYDCTHDNPSPLDKFGSRRLHLPQMGLLSMADIIIATTWGFDQMFLRNYSVVTEKRLYPIEDLIAATQQIEPSIRYSDESSENLFTFEFTFHAPQASSVAVAGTFTDWKPSFRLERDPQGVWRKTKEFSEARIEYKFVINDNEWQNDSSKPNVKDKNGNVNNFIEFKRDGLPPMPSFIQSPDVTKPDLRLVRHYLNRVHSFCNENHAEIFMHTQTPDTIVVVRQLALDAFKDCDAFTTVSRFCFN